ncbi:Hypothetical predicted protein [Octopus vulgaris]|uniref:Uncharacterized protein n=1 Tax=Octopus vulgaris TaxID=6645 RepID=A0AA36BLK6_OCTVU|nr:Hypothetical predicted protein [Octopus vulgaris]
MMLLGKLLQQLTLSFFSTASEGIICAVERVGFRETKVRQDHIDTIKQYVLETPIITLKEIAAKFANVVGFTESMNPGHRHLDGNLDCICKYHDFKQNL